MDTPRHDDNGKYIEDDKFVENVSEKKATSETLGANNAALARAVLWKLDIR